MDKLKLWYATRPKWARKLMQATGYLLAFLTSPVWFPAMFVMWAILGAMLEIIEWWNKP